MPVGQPVLETVTNTFIYMVIGGKPMSIDDYEQYKREIIKSLGDYTCIYILETKKK